MRPAFAALCLIVLAGCEDTWSTCVVEVDGIQACIDYGTERRTCRRAWGGRSSPHDTTRCPDLGFEVRCPGTNIEHGRSSHQDFTAERPYAVRTEAHCEALDGEVFADHR